MSKSKDNSMNTRVKNYLRQTNRPFSANDVFNNLNTIENKLSKTAVNKALEDLAAKQLINEKVNGKQKIYFADQTCFDDISEQKLKEMDQQLEELNKQFDHLRDGLKQKESRLSSFKNSLSLEEIEVQLNEVKKETNELKSKLQTIESKTKDLDPQKNEKVKSERQKLVNEWKKRKRMATSMIDMILEGYPKPKKVLVEEIGIETDEDMKVSVPEVEKK